MTRAALEEQGDVSTLRTESGLFLFVRSLQSDKMYGKSGTGH